ncbi:Calcium/calmodulin-dependent protein kinase type 1 [Galdieria sulphuraria]|uniref:Serine/threonine protein kinase isoform 1 n=1 Tax=Galdieria sulphuraria TaxID=130081 RepID=M2XJB5_GALSU|nr:serine/threonine protein kinase isoform 1 [Galdieria sulphuraria]EME30207.1 serine/threonine protein kinase isoform 1 [Galdieria sulphuraria]GJD08374.1 Calcium/calmodulin-dependent protein kinase type 1 [Galdieria sulphuraria]|eukprot:XP_005706727.1 serine/threonine protein kinase isoform 1 [Galdieria sulphuraria]
MHCSPLIKRAAGEKYHPESFKQRWEILKKLGEGGFSKVTIGKRKSEEDSVYSGFGPTNASRDETISEVAIKCISKEDMRNGSESEELVAREIQTFVTVGNGYPYVAQLYEVCEDEKFVYLIMELLSGGELFDQIVQRGHFSEKDASAIASCMISSVAHCHSKHVVHRDLKPENFVFESHAYDAKLKLIDFGLAAIMASPASTFRTICGSPSYVAPEILYQKPYTYKVDIWSLGVIIYILLAGYAPFEAKDEKELFRRIKHDPVRMEGKEWDAISSDAKHFVASLLEKDPRKRPSCEECLQHPWIEKGQHILEEQHHLEHTVKNLRQFKARRNWHAAVAGVTAMNRMARLAHLHHHVLRSASETDQSGSPPSEEKTNNEEEKDGDKSTRPQDGKVQDPVKEGLETSKETLTSSLKTKNEPADKNDTNTKHMPSEREPFCSCVIS